VAVYVAPEYTIDRANRKYRLISWRYEVLHNNHLMAHGEGFSTAEEARVAGQRAHGKEESVGKHSL